MSTYLIVHNTMLDKLKHRDILSHYSRLIKLQIKSWQVQLKLYPQKAY